MFRWLDDKVDRRVLARIVDGDKCFPCVYWMEIVAARRQHRDARIIQRYYLRGFLAACYGNGRVDERCVVHGACVLAGLSFDVVLSRRKSEWSIDSAESETRK